MGKKSITVTKGMTKKGLTIFMLLFSSLVLGIALGYQYANNLEAKGWWIIMLMVFPVYYLIYSMIFVAIDYIFIPSSFQYVLKLHVFISIILFFLIIETYIVKIDWSAVNDGRIELTKWQKFLHDGSYLQIILISSLVIHLLGRLTIRKK